VWFENWTVWIGTGDTPRSWSGKTAAEFPAWPKATCDWIERTSGGAVIRGRVARTALTARAFLLPSAVP
jgi:hypothetical protein